VSSKDTTGPWGSRPINLTARFFILPLLSVQLPHSCEMGRVRWRCDLDISPLCTAKFQEWRKRVGDPGFGSIILILKELTAIDSFILHRSCQTLFSARIKASASGTCRATLNHDLWYGAVTIWRYSKQYSWCQLGPLKINGLRSSFFLSIHCPQHVRPPRSSSTD
jgi:hypothetical protein